MLPVPPVRAQGESGQSLEYPVKAAILYSIAKFVDWPANSGKSQAMTFCVLGEDPFGAVLDDALRGKRVNERPVALRRLNAPRGIEGCQVLFIAASESRHVDHVLKGLESSPVLTVSEIRGFAQDGGMVNLVLEGGKVRFEVNVQAVEKAGLRMRAQLLDLARIVRPRERGKG